MNISLNDLQDASRIEGAPVWIVLYSDGSGSIKTVYPGAEIKTLVSFQPLEMKPYTAKPCGPEEGLSFLYHANRGHTWKRNE